jgi:serine/threonine protein kinase
LVDLCFNRSNGQRLGDFEILRELGRGGMGVVYEARQVSLNRKVALKVLSGSLGLTSKAVQRFHREAEAAAKLHHTNIVPVYATGEHEGIHFYAMELIEGPSLDRFVRQLRPELDLGPAPPTVSGDGNPVSAEMDKTIAYPQGTDFLGESAGFNSSSLGSGSGYFDNVARLMADVADALEYAHGQGVIHRDIKPSNLLLSAEGRLSINDFGLARMLEQPGMTMTGEFVGTPAYMSPEQIAAGRTPVDNRTDIYSLGATLYELLVLQPPFAGERRDQVLAQILHKEPKPPRKVNRKVPVDLETICLKALDKDPDRRYRTAGSMAEDLRRYVNRFAIRARRAGPIERLRKWLRRRPGLAASLAGALVLGLAAGYFAYEARQSKQQRLIEKQQAALLAAMSGDLNAADQAIDEAELLGASPTQLRLLRGQVALDRGDDKEARHCAEQAVKLAPDSVAGQALLALASQRAGDWERYMQGLQALERLQPVTAQDYLFKGRVESLDDPAGGLVSLEEAVHQLPGSSIIRLALADAQCRYALLTGKIGDAEQAVEYANTAKGMLSGNPKALETSFYAHMGASILLGANGQPDKRMVELDQARRDVEALEKSSTLAMAVTARLVYFDHVESKALLQECHRAMEKTGNPRVNRYCAAILYRMGKTEEALKVLDDCLPGTSGNRDYSISIERGYILAELHDGLTRALAAYQEAVRAAPKDTAVWGPDFVLRLLGRKQEAVAYCRKLREQTGGHTFPWRREWNRQILSYLCADLPAAELLQAAGSSRGNECEGHYCIALTLLADGDRDGARQHFTAAVATGYFVFTEYRWSRAFLSRMDHDPSWPPWIQPIKKGTLPVPLTRS